MEFEALGITQDIIKALKEIGFETPTPIQEFAIPRILDGEDIIAQSQTGSGKTATFGLPMLDRIVKGQGVQGLIVVPTRELAEQIGRELVKFGKYKELRIAIVYGGVGMNQQIHEIAAAEVVVATPGRLLDHYYSGSINLDTVSMLVLDEADRMLDMGFIDDVTKIIKSTPQDRQTLMFGATLPLQVTDLARAYMREPKKITASTHVAKEYLDQYYFSVQVNEKFSVLVHLLQTQKPSRTMIFTGTRRNAEAVAHNLVRQGMRAECLHGGLTQNRRTQVTDAFYAGKLPILVATDVASRGLDIKDVSHVINYDVPKQPEDYVHRIGRTARAGATGVAYTIVSPPDFDNFRPIEAICPTPIKKAEELSFRRVFFDSGKRGPMGGDGYGAHGARPGGFSGRQGGFEMRDGMRDGGFSRSRGDGFPRGGRGYPPRQSQGFQPRSGGFQYRPSGDSGAYSGAYSGANPGGYQRQDQGHETSRRAKRMGKDW